MENDALIARLMKTFLGEAEEHVQALNRGLLELEKQPAAADRGATLKTLFRTAHSLKGAAHAVTVPAIETACHKLEELFATAVDGRSIDADLFRALFAIVDAIDDMVKQLRAQKDLDAQTLAQPLQRLDTALAGKTAKEPTRPRPPAPSEPPARPAAAVDERPLSDRLVRIPAEKLDALMAYSGELMVAQRGAAARAADAAGTLETVKRWRSDWRTVERAMERLLREGSGTEPSAAPAAAERRPGVSPRSTAAFRRATEAMHRIEQDLQRLAGGLVADRRVFERATGMLDSEVRRARLLPFAEACEGLERVVRDLAKSSGKEAELAINGAEIELDRSVLEGLKDPLLHLVRNAMDHGVELPSVRRARGKPSRGRVTVAAALRGARVEVTVADDGAGLDIAAIRERAREKNIPETADDRELAQHIFLPGFSTAPIVTEISGRGVGLDAVKTQAETMRGGVDVAFEAGRGTRFTMTLPLTLTTIRVMLVRASGRTLAFDNASIERLLRIRADDLRSIDGRDVLILGGPPLPVVALSELLGMPPAEPAGDRHQRPAVLLAVAGQRVVLLVDELIAEQEAMVRSLGPRLAGLKEVTGGLVLPNGRVAPILNAADLAHRAARHLPSRPSLPEASQAVTRPRLIVADDSVTTRTLEKSILEAAGYEVTVASDGAEAWRLLQEKGADLVVSDVEMPRMDGFELTATIRGSARFRRLPVILVTGRETESDKARGLEVGANAYLPKSTFDQTMLIETIRQML
ncbi:histidine kinase [Hypericibacter adhaerens]|uniref:Chemotaxis protein CheA n=1 Tax=Hypericibacter adhaerens TaxID=2602016 RepID=A0A5J6MTQ5_9PROT|nr:response regulator [Hypericibacter adhaerens]QEX21072.1 histidine kinase [Hypericibacter adhaerens]